MRAFAEKPKASQSATPARFTTLDRAHSGQNHDVNSICHLQPTFGHQSIPPSQQADVGAFAVRSTLNPSTRFGHDFSQIPVHSPVPAHPAPLARSFGSLGIFPKLAINNPGDAFEQEADRVADQVTSVSASKSTPVRVAAANVTTPQAKCASCEEEEATVDRKKTGEGPSAVPAIVSEVLRSSGQPLDPNTRAFMEPRFGYDFSKVRVHADERATSSANAIQALAYTSGESIVFGSAQHRPDTSSGRHLLAHELAHVVQQAHHPDSVIRRQPANADEEDAKKAPRKAHHVRQQMLVSGFLSDALMIGDGSKPSHEDSLYHNTAELVVPTQTAKATLKVLTPTHYSTETTPVYFDDRVKYPDIGGDYPPQQIAAADAGRSDPRAVKPDPGTGGVTVAASQPQQGASPGVPKKEEHGPSRVDPRGPYKAPDQPSVVAPKTSPAKAGAPPVIAWSPGEIKLFLGGGEGASTSDITKGEFKHVFVHEGQHVSDWIYLKNVDGKDWKSTLEVYKSEFNAFWIQPPIPGSTVKPAAPAGERGSRDQPITLARTSEESGFGEATALAAKDQFDVSLPSDQSCADCGGSGSAGKSTAPPTTRKTNLKNARQKEIFEHLLQHYKKRKFECFYVCNDDFFNGVNSHVGGSSINLVNSTRLIGLNIELQSLTPGMTRAEVEKTGVRSVIESLDDVDWAFLSDGNTSPPFWKSATEHFPAPLLEALKALARKGSPTPADVTNGLDRAFAKLKAS